MDITSFINTILSCGVTLTICLINNSVQTNKQRAESDKQIALIKYQIEELKREIEKYNNVKERVAKLEGLALLWEEKLKSLMDKVNTIESDIRHDNNDDGK